MSLNLSKAYTPSSGQVANSTSYNTDISALFNAFDGLEDQSSTLGGLTITPSANSTTTFKITNAAGTSIFNIDTTNQTITSATQPRARAYKAAAQAIGDNSATSCQLDTEDFDVGTMHDNSTNNTRLTIPTGGDGVYLLIATFSFASNATGYRSVEIRNDSAVAIGSQRVTGPDASVDEIISVSGITTASAGDYFEAIVYQNSGGALNVSSGVGAGFMAIKLW